MSVLERLSEYPIIPIYEMTSPNQQVLLSKSKIEISKGSASETVNAEAEVTLRFTPDEFVEIKVPSVSSDLKEYLREISEPNSAETRIEFVDHESSVEVFWTTKNDEYTIYHSTREPIEIWPESERIQSAVFHIFNWPVFHGPQDFILESEGGASRHGRILFEVDGWLITLVEMKNVQNLAASLKEAGGFIQTHVGRIERLDSLPFSTNSLKKLKFALNYYFSFVLGRWNGPSLIVGFDRDSHRVYEEWGLGRYARGGWNGSTSWFDKNHSGMIAEAFPGFWVKWNDDVWHTALSHAIHWYMSANQLGSGVTVDSALLFTQAALELLSWTHCVKCKKISSAKDFGPGGRSAREKLNLLITSLGIPTEIPPSLNAIHSKSGEKWKDSMHAITDLRNGLVHPNKEASVPEGAYYEAWTLSQWYIEMILLRLFNFNGKCANRITQRFVGQVEQVPWIPNSGGVTSNS